MSDTKYFRFPFALTGDKTAIPDPVDGGGAISYTQGYGPDYEIDPASPGARRIEREKFNQALYDITTNLRQYQLEGFPQWVTAAQNGGSAVAYPFNAYVRYDAGAGIRVWRSTSSPNTATPGATADWELVDGAQPDASTGVKGVVQLATNAEAIAGANTTKAIVPSSLASALASYFANAPTAAKNTRSAQVATTQFAMDVGLNFANAINHVNSGVTLTNSSAGALILSNGGTITLPLISTMPRGGVIWFQCDTTSPLTIAAQGGDTINNYASPVSSVTLNQGQSIILAARQPDAWLILGRLAA